jgi:hypothetical protein
VNVTVVKREIMTAFKVPLANPSPKRQWVKQWTLVGHVTKLEKDSVVFMAAMETYEDFVSERTVVDENNPEEMAAHIRDVQSIMKENIGVKLTPGQMEKLMALFAKHAAGIGTVKGKAPPVSEVGRAKPFRINTDGATYV